VSSPQNPADRLVVALDFPSFAESLGLINRLQGHVTWVKIGMELFYACGPSILARFRDRGLNVFLDLKLYDIPNTVAAAIHSVADWGPSLLTLHASGGPAMLAAARDAAAGRLGLLGVTVLTSMDAAELAATGVPHPPEQQVSLLAGLALNSGMAGLVCSAREVGALRQQFGPSPLLIVPGIRPAGAAADDQRRTATPAEAIAAGASQLVIGRPITRAADPAQAFQAILAEIDGHKSI
jgi:orotidine-5'-phosphate decarboxylase